MIKRRALSWSAGVVTGLALLLACAGTARAQAGSTGSSTAPAPGQGPTDAAELEAFLDDLVGRQMAERHIAGAAVAVVKDGALFLAKGYGFADVANGVRVNPETTVFPTGSVGKLFTWTAVMQLVEQGRLDLDADVNTYLDFRIADDYPQPVTLKHLMTHTSGFEDVLVGGAVTDAKDLVPAHDWLVAHPVARVFPPGDSAGYSNYNAILAGYIVSRVAGQAYEDYVEQHIFDPLGMTHSSVHWPLPERLRRTASLGYRFIDGNFLPLAGYLAQPAVLPSGAHRASVTDMARFMIAHLEGGRYQDATIPEARILAEATARQMQSTLYAADPRLLGTAYGFFDVSDNGQHAIGHEGYLPPMHTFLLLLPDQGLGVYAVYNSAESGGLTTQHTGFQRAFFDHYYPVAPVEAVAPPVGFAARAGRFVGSYRVASAARSTLAKVAYISDAVAVSDPGDGTLRIAMNGLELRVAEVAPLYFRQVDGPFAILFREDEQGRITRMDTDLMPEYTALKLRWYETPGFNMALLQACALVFLSVIPIALLRALRNRRRPGVGPVPRGARIAGLLILALGVLNLVFVAGTFRWVMQPTELHDPLLIYKVVLGLGVVSAGLTAVALVYAIPVWKNGYWSLAGRLYYSVVTIAAVAFVWFLDYWNLLGWRY